MTTSSKSGLSVQQIITGLREKDEVVYRYIYQHWFNDIERMVCGRGGSPVEARTVFQDGLLTFYTKISDPSFQLTGSLQGFFYKICSYVWLKARTKKTSDRLEFPDSNDQAFNQADDTDVEEAIHQRERYQLYTEKLSELEELCQTVLRLFHNGHKIAEIADLTGMTSANNTKVKLYNCRKNLTKRIKQDARYVELKTNYGHVG